MAKKAIAAVLLLVITAWAEMTLAPMLAMHAGHMHPGHEAVADMPHHAGHHPAKSKQGAAAEHPCCPKVHKTEPADVLELVSGVPACDDPHSCCFRQGPQSVPAPTRDMRTDDQKLAQDMAPAAAVEPRPLPGTARHTLGHGSLALNFPPDVLGMTLRI